MKKGSGGSLRCLAMKASLAFFLALYLALLLRYSSAAAALVRRSLPGSRGHEEKTTTSGFMDQLRMSASTVGLVNMGRSEWRERSASSAVEVRFDRVSENVTWEQLFPEWIEERDGASSSCPEIPMPDFAAYGEVDAVVARMPCGRSSRDAFQLQVHLVAAGLAARRGRRDGRGRVRVVFCGACSPMIDVFRCDDIVRREGEWWEYEVEAWRLEEKMGVPVGTCKLAVPQLRDGQQTSGDEAYATVLHSTHGYVCGAIALAQSLLLAGTRRDLLLLHDPSISPRQLRLLAAAGWTLIPVARIRNPHAQRGAYNEHNYTKLRLWQQLTSYRKVVFVDADALVLRSLDFLFAYPHLSAAANDGVLFNSGVMVLEPSECTFRYLLRRAGEVVPYNGGDQGLLNEAFAWWHRLPRGANFLKEFWSGTAEDRERKEAQIEAGQVHAIHYLGIKPWKCRREYDCNWNVKGQRVYASDAAHRRWWEVHDRMGEGLRRACRLTRRREAALERERKRAEEEGFPDQHWKIDAQGRGVE